MWTGSEIIDILSENNVFSGTSLYIYDRKMFRQRIKLIQKAFESWNLLYSMKANPNSDILKEALGNGIGIDAASKNEVLQSYQGGFSKDMIYYSSPGKTKNDLLECYDKCIIIADSVNEVKRIMEIAEKKNIIIKIGVRVNIKNDKITNNAFEVMGGMPTKFGISPSELNDLIKEYNDSNILISGIHIYFGSQILSEETIINNLLFISDFALNINKYTPLSFINFGGGFGIPYDKEDAELNVSNISCDKKLRDRMAMLSMADIKCNIELGRYLIGEAGVFVASVEDIKKVEDQKFVILSSGMNGFFRPIFTKEFHKLEKCNSTQRTKEKVTIVGNLCTPIDQYYSDYLIEPLSIGDWVWFSNAGAYGFTMSMLDFINHDKPMEIVI